MSAKPYSRVKLFLDFVSRVNMLIIERFGDQIR